MDCEQVRNNIDILLKKHEINYQQVSLMLGKPAGWMHQFIKRKSPKRLNEIDRKNLAVILNVPEQELTDIDLSAPALPVSFSGVQTLADIIASGVFSLVQKFADKKNDIIAIDILDATACCGSGIENLSENIAGKWLMPLVDFRQITMSSPENIKMIKVKGDSMEPTLKDGDWVLVDISRTIPDSDGLFLLRLAGSLAVKRVQCGLGSDISVLSDNRKYPPLPATLEEIPVVGRVIYTLTAEKVG